jgi:class 3 adenylate cyclase
MTYSAMTYSIRSGSRAVNSAGVAAHSPFAAPSPLRSVAQPAVPAPMPNIDRRLAAVLIADVAGYSRLMERDEAGTHLRLRDLRLGLIEPAIRQHGGRIVRSTGDGLLVQFASATAALRCAVLIQREMADRNARIPEEDQIRYRIGINVADILFDEHDIAGGGVNLAARLETLAQPGGICISRALKELIQEDLDVHYLDAGSRRVKNISRPVRVYRVLAAPLTRMGALRASAAERLGTLWRKIVIASSATAIAALAVAAPMRAGEPSVPPGPAAAALPLTAPAAPASLRSLPPPSSTAAPASV